MSNSFILLGKNHYLGTSSMKIAIVLTHIPNPRMNKRIEAFRKFAQVVVVCVRRTSQNIWEPAFEDIPHYTFPLDMPSSSEPIKRIISERQFSKLVLDKLQELSPNVIYTEGIDVLSIACKYKRRNVCSIFYEVADLRECFIEKPNTIKKKLERLILQRVEKKCFKSVTGLTLTSDKFYDVHFKDLIDRDKVVVWENSPDLGAFDKYVHKEFGEFTVGFIGGIRYLSQMKMLVDAAEEVQCNVLFAGAGGTAKEYEEIKAYCAGKNWVRFSGRYDYKTQIANLYGSVDCVYAVYDSDNPNVRIALPNKLYESIYCELPIIVAKGTYLADIVEKNDIGIAVDSHDGSDLKNALTALINNKDYYKQIRANCRKARSLLDTTSSCTHLCGMIRSCV